MEGLKLDLEIRKTATIRGESIRFALTLTNAGRTPANLLDDSSENRAFSIHVTNVWGFDAWGDQMSIEVREGEHIDQPRNQPRKPLAPGEKWIVQGDIIAWIGDLEPGDYSVQGHYMNSPQIMTETAVAQIKVSEAVPVYSGSAVQNLPLPLSPRITAWLHRAGSEYQLFALESSPKHPPVTYANVPVAPMEIPSHVTPSSYNVAPAAIQHMIWSSADGNLRVLRFRSDLPPEPAAVIPLPDEHLEPFATPYSDPKGNLHALLVTPEGETACLLQLIGKAKPVFKPVKAEPPLSGPKCALWCRDESLVFAWVEPEEGLHVSAALVPLAAPPGTITGNPVFSAEHPVINLQLVQVYNEGSGKHDRILYALVHDQVNDILMRWKIDLADGKSQPDGEFEVDGIGGLRMIQSVMTDEMVPLYLFAKTDGAIVFADSTFSKLHPVKDANFQPVKVTSFPQLVVPTSFSRIPGRYVRFIDQGKRFAFVKLP
jgi:hypothetical protein